MSVVYSSQWTRRHSFTTLTGTINHHFQNYTPSLSLFYRCSARCFASLIFIRDSVLDKRMLNIYVYVESVIQVSLKRKNAHTHMLLQTGTDHPLTVRWYRCLCFEFQYLKSIWALFWHDASILDWILGLNVHSCKLNQYLMHPQLENDPLFHCDPSVLPVWDVTYTASNVSCRTKALSYRDLTYREQTDRLTRKCSLSLRVRLSVFSSVKVFFFLSTNLYYGNNFKVSLAKIFPSLTHQKSLNVLNLGVVLSPHSSTLPQETWSS